MSAIPPVTSRLAAAQHRHWTLVLWGLVLLVVAGFVSINLQRGKGAAGPEQLSPQLALTCRYAVGLEILSRDFPGIVKLSPAQREQLVAQLEEAGVTPTARVAVLSALAELKGNAYVLARIDRLLADEPTFPPEHRQDLLLLHRLYSNGGAVSPSQRQELIRRYGWTAELALTAGPDGEQSPQRRQVLAKARGTAVTLVAAAGLVAGALVLGFLLGTVAVILTFHGRLSSAYAAGRRILDTHRVRYLELFVVSLALMLGMPLLGLVLGRRWVSPLLPLLILIVVWLPFRGVPWAEALQGLGWHPGRGAVRELAWGIVGYLAGLPLIALGIALTYLTTLLIQRSGLHRFIPEDASHPIVEQLQAGSAGRVVVLFLMACVVAPLLEETFFRGAFYHYFRSRLGIPVSVLATGFIFAAVHPQSIAGIPALTAIGAVLALIREWRGSILASMAAHACNNLAVLALALLLFH